MACSEHQTGYNLHSGGGAVTNRISLDASSLDKGVKRPRVYVSVPDSVVSLCFEFTI